MKTLVTVSLLFFSFLTSNLYGQSADPDLQSEAADLIGGLGGGGSTIVGIKTTMTEYNYITKGYKIQMESGLDMKKGYTFKNTQKFNINRKGVNRQVSYQQLYRDGDKSPCATMMKFNRIGSKYESYLCIPSNNSDYQIWQKAKNDFESAVNEWQESSRDYAWGMFKIISVLSSESISNNTSTSNINIEVGGGLNGRKTINQPEIKGGFNKPGRVTLKVCIDSNGNVLEAEFTQRGSTTTDYNLVKKSKENARNFKFDNSGLDKQCGTITYTYIIK